MTTLVPIVKCSAGLDVHQKMVVACILREDNKGEIESPVKEFTTFPAKLKE